MSLIYVCPGNTDESDNSSLILNQTPEFYFLNSHRFFTSGWSKRPLHGLCIFWLAVYILIKKCVSVVWLIITFRCYSNLCCGNATISFHESLNNVLLYLSWSTVKPANGSQQVFSLMVTLVHVTGFFSPSCAGWVWHTSLCSDAKPRRSYFHVSVCLCVWCVTHI